MKNPIEILGLPLPDDTVQHLLDAHGCDVKSKPDRVEDVDTHHDRHHVEGDAGGPVNHSHKGGPR